MGRKKKDLFCTMFAERYPERSYIMQYVREALDTDDVQFSDMTAVNLTKIAETIKKHVSDNTAKTYFSILKAFIGLHEETEDVPTKQYRKVLHARQTPSQNVYLTEEEIQRLENYLVRLNKKGDTQKRADRCAIDVLHPFLAECYCGARGCDVAEFDDSNFQNGFLMYVSKKTQVLSQMPVHSKLRGHLDCKASDEHHRASTLRTLKRICKECGIDEMKTLYYHGKMVTQPKWFFVGFHTARRSFATNLHLRNVPLAVIAQMMNHGNDLQMTQRYIVTDINSLTDNAMAFFA